MNDYNSRLFGEKNTLSDTADSAVDKLPKMMTIREIAATGILPEYAIRTLVREGKIPAIRCGTAVRINFNTLASLGQTALVSPPR